MAIAAAADAQGQFIGGTLVDKKTTQPLALVRIVLLDSAAKSILSEIKADAQGTFLLQVPAAGVYRLAFARDIGLLGTTDTIAVSGSDFVQRRFLIDLTEVGFYLESQVTNPVSPKAGNRAPRYPDELRRNGVRGNVVAQFVVDTSGRADLSTFRNNPGAEPAFVRAVRDALPAMEFYPAKIDGRAVRQLVFMPFSFNVWP